MNNYHLNFQWCYEYRKKHLIRRGDYKVFSEEEMSYSANSNTSLLYLTIDLEVEGLINLPGFTESYHFLLEDENE